MSTTTEWAIFRKTDPMQGVTPMEAWRFDNKEQAERAIRGFIDGPLWLEARCREVSDWTKPSTYSEAEIEDLRARLTGGKP